MLEIKNWWCFCVFDGCVLSDFMCDVMTVHVVTCGMLWHVMWDGISCYCQIAFDGMFNALICHVRWYFILLHLMPWCLMVCKVTAVWYLCLFTCMMLFTCVIFVKADMLYCLVSAWCCLLVYALLFTPMLCLMAFMSDFMCDVMTVHVMTCWMLWHVMWDGISCYCQ